MTASPALAAPDCPINYGAHADIKPNKLYLLFPTEKIEDPLKFPAHGFNPATSWLPLQFKISDLPNAGSFEQLTEKVHDVVADTFCEFNVQVIAITTPLPAPRPPERRNTIGIGTDKGRPCNAGPLFGQAYTPGGDPGDSNPRDFARVWAGSYNCADIASDLHGIPLDLERWANSIGGTVAHEAGHNYGLSHADGDETKRPFEDDWMNHLMKGDGYTYRDRAARRHFSDFETSVLARNVGLAMDTMWTWNFKNPNAESVAKLRIELESPEKHLILSWPFAGRTSPWIDPVLTSVGTRVEGHTTYTLYQIEWSAGNAEWSEGPPGQVPQDKRFSVGATLSSPGRDGPSEITVTKVALLDANDQALPQQPPWMRFDTGTFDSHTRDLNVLFKNSLDRPLVLRDVEVRDLPRIMSIKAMMANRPIIDISGRKLQPWKGKVRCPLSQYTVNEGTPCPPAESTIQSGAPLNVAVANRKQGRHISVQRREDQCKLEPNGHGLKCHDGITIDDLFPATTMYITATVADPAGIESQLFYQIAGRRSNVP